MSTPKSKDLFYAWWANLDTNLPIIAAVTGLLYAIILLYPSCNNQYTYHNLKLINKRELVKKIVSHRIAKLSEKAAVLSKEKPAEKADSIKKISMLLGQANAELNRLDYFNTDTSLKYFTRYFSSDRESYSRAINKLTSSDTLVKIPVLLSDTCYYISSTPLILFDSLQIKKQPLSLMQWSGTNTSFGLWFVISIAQMSMWFLLAVLAVGIARSTKYIVPALTYNFKNAAFFSLLPLAVIGVFTVLLYLKLIDSYVIPDAWFMEGYNSRMLWYSVPGYLVTIICFSGYLFLSNKLELLNSAAGVQRTTIAASPTLANNYSTLTRAFDGSFLFSAIILTVFVLWLGILFTAVNGSEAMRFYTVLSGKQFLNYDYVYLVGLLHSLLLLVFYVPVRLRFNALEIKQQDTAIQKTAGSKQYISSLWDSISTVLVTASPIIVSVIQKFISNVLQG
jgi:hypothetical protein